MRRGALAILISLALLAACGERREAEAPGGRGDAPSAVQPARSDSPTLAAVKRRGRLLCGVHEGLIGFAYVDARGEWRGFDVDFCRAVAAAVFGDPDRVRFVPLTNAQRFEALKSGRVDVLWRNTSWTMSREARDGLVFAGINYFDGQGFLVRRALNLASAAELNGARVCVQAASTSQPNLADWFRSRGLEHQVVVAPNFEAARAAYAREDCDALTGDVAQLAGARTVLPNPEQHVILPEIISKEPLGPVVRRGDEQWAALIRWTLNALILAEELGVTSGNAEERAREASDPETRRLLGVEGEFGEALGLSNDWALNALKATGNYGEIFERNLGAQSALDLERGLNAQWRGQPGGLIYALPIR